MKALTTSCRALAAALALLLAPALASAQILIGQTAGFTGAAEAGVKETTAGARLYFDAVNARGGVAGQKLELISLDDRFEPKLAADNAQTLIVQRKVIALLLTRGTPHTEAVAPLLVQFKIPLVGPSTGATLFHEPVHPYIFNVRATYQREAERAVKHLSTVGLQRIAVLRTDDSFGADGATGAAKGFASASLRPVLEHKFNRDKPDFSAIAAQLVKADAQAVLFIGAGASVAEGTRAIRAAGSKAQIVTLSNNASSGFIKQMGEHARGTIVSQVFPPERSRAMPMIREAIEMAGAGAAETLSPAMLEGFAAAKVLVDALRRTKPPFTPEKLLAGLNATRNLDLGGMELSYSATDHTGLDFVDLSIVGGDGTFRR